MDRKAQMLGHIIVFVIGLLVVAAILYFGFSVLQGMEEKRCQVKAVQFGTDLSTSLDRNRDWGVNKVVRVEMPCEAVAVCFVDRRTVDERIAAAVAGPDVTFSFTGVANDIQESFIQGSVNSQDPTNVFTINSDGRVSPVSRFSGVSDNAPVSVSEPTDGQVKAVCLGAPDGTLSVRMQGQGTLARVTTP